MKWTELKKLVTEEYDRRSLASNVRYRSLDRIEEFIKTSSKAANSIEMLLQVDKNILKEGYRQFRGTDNISGVDSSCINEIYSQLRKYHEAGQDYTKRSFSTYEPAKNAVSKISVDQLMDASEFRSVKLLNDLDIPDIPGIYVIKIKDIKKLPEMFSKVLQERKHNILYIGISTTSLRDRFWDNELHAQEHGTFFRSLGAVLGYLPKTGSLKGKKKNYNYKFSEYDTAEIIGWIEDNLEVNFIAHSDNLEEIEKSLITTNLPLLNLDKNPTQLPELKNLRRKCVAMANDC